jgi:hypothetical protein
MALPTPAEARLVAFEKPYRELTIGDQIGPADVSLPPTHTVVARPERSTEDRFASVVPVDLVDTVQGTTDRVRPRQSDTVLVRRYYATVTVTRAGGAVDARKPKMWLRPIGDAVTLEEAWRLKLQPGDALSFVAA